MQEDMMCCICLQVLFFLPVFVCLVCNFTLPLKHNTEISGKTKIKCGISIPAILKEMLTSNKIFAGIYSRHSHAMTSFNTENGSKAVDLAFNSSNGKWSVLLLAKY